jgi:hypothetical protein
MRRAAGAIFAIGLVGWALPTIRVCAGDVMGSVHPATGVSIAEVQNYTFGNYGGEFKSPPNADGNPRRAFIVTWKDHPYRFVFAHEGSYCPWIELPDGAGVCFQFFEGNDGWAELFNQFGRQERNSFVDILERGPQRVWVHWTYFGVNEKSGQPAYRASEDFWCYPNGLILRRQQYESLMPNDPHGYAREPIEMIGMCPVGKLWKDVLVKANDSEERHALAALDPFSDKRYDLFWTPKPNTIWDSTHRHAGCDWKDLDDARGIVLAIPMRSGAPFCIFGDASGFPHDTTRIKNHTFHNAGGLDWGSTSWDHWPIGWLNSQGHPVDADSLKKYPNHFSPAGMDFFAMKNEDVARGVYWSLYGVGDSGDLEPVRKLAREWLDQDPKTLADLSQVGKLSGITSHQ